MHWLLAILDGMSPSTANPVVTITELTTVAVPVLTTTSLCSGDPITTYVTKTVTVEAPPFTSTTTMTIGSPATTTIPVLTTMTHTIRTPESCSSSLSTTVVVETETQTVTAPVECALPHTATIAIPEHTVTVPSYQAYSESQITIPRHAAIIFVCGLVAWLVMLVLCYRQKTTRTVLALLPTFLPSVLLTLNASNTASPHAFPFTPWLLQIISAAAFAIALVHMLKIVGVLSVLGECTEAVRKWWTGEDGSWGFGWGWERRSIAQGTRFDHVGKRHCSGEGSRYVTGHYGHGRSIPPWGRPPTGRFM